MHTRDEFPAVRNSHFRNEGRQLKRKRTSFSCLLIRIIQARRQTLQYNNPPANWVVSGHVSDALPSPSFPHPHLAHCPIHLPSPTLSPSSLSSPYPPLVPLPLFPRPSFLSPSSRSSYLPLPSPPSSPLPSSPTHLFPFSFFGLSSYTMNPVLTVPRPRLTYLILDDVYLLH